MILWLSLLHAPALAQDLPASKVVMPWNEFKRLQQQVDGQQQEEPDPPKAWTLSSSQLEGVVLDDSAVRFKARIQVEVHQDKGWVSIPLMPSTVGLESARIAGREVAVSSQRGWYTLISDRRGSYTVELEFVAAVTQREGRSQVEFELPSSGSSTFSLEISEEQLQEFNVLHAPWTQTSSPREGVQRVEAVLAAGRKLAATWQRSREEAAPEGEEASPELIQPRIYAEVSTLVGIGEGLIKGRSRVDWEILHRGVEALELSLPSSVSLLDVRGKGLRDWSVVEAEGEQRILVELNFEALGSYQLVLDYEQSIGEGSVSLELPRLELMGVERSKGFVGVEALSNLEIAAGEVRGATTLDARELPPSILGQTDQPVLLGFKVRNNDWTLPLEVSQHEDVDVLVALADMAQGTSVMTLDGRQMHRVVWQVRNNRRQFMRLQLPEGLEIWSTMVAGKAVKPARDESGQVLIPLIRSQASGGALAAYEVELVWVEEGSAPDERGEGEASFRLPQVDMPVSYLQWTVYMPELAEVGRRDVQTSLRPVDRFKGPLAPPEESYYEEGGAIQQELVKSAAVQQSSMQAGVQPVEVTLPLEGTPRRFEKLLVLDEPLTVAIRYRGLSLD